MKKYMFALFVAALSLSSVMAGLYDKTDEGVTSGASSPQMSRVSKDSPLQERDSIRILKVVPLVNINGIGQKLDQLFEEVDRPCEEVVQESANNVAEDEGVLDSFSEVYALPKLLVPAE